MNVNNLNSQISQINLNVQNTKNLTNPQVRRNLSDCFQSKIRTLKVLVEQIDHWDSILLY